MRAPFAISPRELAKLTLGVTVIVAGVCVVRTQRASAAPPPPTHHEPSVAANAATSTVASEQTPPACGDEMARVGAFCMDRYEAYVVELADDGSEHPHSPFSPVDGLSVRAKVAPGVVPQGYISQQQAARACQNAGKRLCSAEEFGQACRGPSAQSSYPYGGSKRQPDACNEGKGSAVTLLFGAGASYDMAELNDPRLNQLASGLAKTGAHPRCVSAYGVYDLVGNLHEWGSDEQNGRGRFRGGYYGDAEVNGSGCGYVTRAHATSYHDYSTGFRCCSDARD